MTRRAGQPTWGVVTTIRAELRDILGFVSHHLDLGAHRLYLYLDEPDPPAYNLLKAHPKIRVTVCDDAYWDRIGKARPVKHQVRQGTNATHAYSRRVEIDWLGNFDVDEFLWPGTDTVAGHLAALPAQATCARLRPIEALAGGDACHFKAFIPGDQRQALADTLYPQFGRYLRGGFLSHVAGKLFVRTGLRDVEFRIHNIFVDGKQNPGGVDLPQIDLCHCHAKPWKSWLQSFRYRHAKGSYRPELPPAISKENGGMNLHDLFSYLEETKGEAGLRKFFDEVCADTPALRERLGAAGLLRRCDLQLDAKIARHFPDFA